MAHLVGGVAASHSTLMNTDFDRVVDRTSAQAFRDALGKGRSFLTELKPDAIIYIGSNHFRGFFLDLLPAFSIGVGKVAGSGESGTPKGQLPTDQTLARHLLEGLTARDIDMAFSIDMTIDHGITHAVQHLSPSPEIPVVPIVINIFAPPLPSITRSAALGRAIGEVVRALPGDQRVAVVGSGGLSHTLPWPDWRHPATEQDRFLVEAWLNGRSDWQRYEAQRRELIRSADAVINPEFDARFLSAIAEMEASELAATFVDLDAEAGNGGAELRNWIATRTAVGPADVDVIGYWPIAEWLTGMGVVTFASRSS
ncbi:DODA-type extradiol aromatic ring-opening family dioxygenase [Micromonospora craniellae]|uniref:Catechol 1,2-dioxygenase n=1 Tax=Micromonospora craniellae TaxID=2294034 RepID=A0A372FYG3_9ACTN|nr:catechol 1,2-dioxygenase [Micromonospora craniellae]QOC93406.1 catechol 1,2-dioxygenase [Micromonospora craniellae]RFS45851.1 catechol 1,2-dioxygenase [Micromonospora craniellae]